MDHKGQAIHIMTIANSIIGVSIIAMPYCFKQCGIVLSTVILIVSSILSRLSCHLLLKSAIMARRRTFEFLAFHAFGPLGKFIIEIGLIGFLLGTCIAFFVVMGDLGPSIVTKMTGTKATDTLRTSILMALALFCVLPLGLLRNIDSLTSVCTATIGFYFCLVLKIVVQSIPHIFSGDWVEKVELWRPAGFLQCLPIFSMALFCQTQIFEIYQAIPNASLERMNDLIRKAVNICTGVYIFVGGFGYIAFCRETFSGNILMSFPSSLMTEVIKIGFVLSVAFSFPLIIFPCRASLYSLLYKRTYSIHEGGTDKYIPEGRFKGLTFVIVFVSLITGVMIPSIELVLGLVGSTIGIMICVVFPAMCFICISTKNTNERILAQVMLFVGIIVMVLGTYANLYAMEEIQTNSVITERVIIQEPDILKLVKEDPALKVIDILKTTKTPEEWKADKKEEIEKKVTVKEIRHEPPQPEAPIEAPKPKDLPNPQNVEDKQVVEVRHEPPQPVEPVDGPKTKEDKQPVERVTVKEIRHEPPQPEEPIEAPKAKELPAVDKESTEHKQENKPRDSNIEKPEEKPKEVSEVSVLKKQMDDPVLQEPLKLVNNEQPEQLNEDKKLPKVAPDAVEMPKVENINLQLPSETNDVNKINENVKDKLSNKKAEEVDKEAIEKEEKELREQERKLKDEEKNKLDFIKSLEEQNKEQKKLVEEEKKILEEIKLRQQALEQEKQQKEILMKQQKLQAVEQIQEIAKKAIETLSANDAQNEVKNIPSSNIAPNQSVKDVPLAVPINANIDSKLLSNQSGNENNKLEQPLLPQIGLNEQNLVPLPLAVSSNFSEKLNNMPAAVGIMADVSRIIALKSTTLVPKQNPEKTNEKKNIEGHEKDKGVNLLDVLRTKAEKVTVLNQNKQEAVIQHREIRSVDNIIKDDANEPQKSVIESYKMNEIGVEKAQKETDEENIKETEKSEKSCDRADKAEETKKQDGVNEKVSALKMITRLSEPELVSVKLPSADKINVDVVLKPLKRDLKSYKLKRK